MAAIIRKASKKGKPQGNPTEKKWLHPTEALQQGSVVYSVKLLGLTEVPQAKGTEIVREAIKKVRFANHIKKSEAGLKASKLRKVEIKISIDNIKIEDSKTKEQIHFYPLHRISYCADDKRDKKLFAFIAKDTGMPQHNCFVFECEKMAEELTLTVGQAFDLAYRRFLEKKTAAPDSQKKLTEMEEKIKMAEEEKEALRRKIAQLELASERKETHSNGTSETNQTPSDQNQIDLLGLFGEFAVTPASQPQTLVPQATPVQDMTFDPFAGVTAQPPAAMRRQSEEGPPNSPDFNEFLPLQVEEPVLKPTPKGVIPQALPPPPSKRSVKAANQLKAAGILPLVTSPTSPKSQSFPSPLLSPSNEGPETDENALYATVNKNPVSNGVSVGNMFDPFASANADINQTTIQAGI